MNRVAVHEQLSALPASLPIEKRRQRVTTLLGLAAAITIPLPTQAIESGARRQYFYDNAEVVRSALFEVNEVIPFGVDQSCELAFRVWDKRYELAFAPIAANLFGVNAFDAVIAQNVPEYGALCIDADAVRATVDLLRSNLPA